MGWFCSLHKFHLKILSYLDLFTFIALPKYLFSLYSCLYTFSIPHFFTHLFTSFFFISVEAYSHDVSVTFRQRDHLTDFVPRVSTVLSLSFSDSSLQFCLKIVQDVYTNSCKTNKRHRRSYKFHQVVKNLNYGL